MKKIDVIYAAYLKSQIGPSGTLRRINKYRDYFLSRGCDVTIFTPDCYSSPTQQASNVINAKKSTLGLKATIRKKIKALVPHSFVLSALYIYRSYASTKNVCEYYFKQGRTPDVVVFHGDYECFRYIKRVKNPNVKKVVFLHSDGIPFKMDLIYYPKLKGTFMERWLMKVHSTVRDNVDKCVFIAKIGMDNFLNNNPDYPREKCFLLINGIDDLSDEEKNTVREIRNASHNEFKYNLVCTGTLLHRKGQDQVVEALSRIPKDKRKEIHVTFLGNGPLRAELDSMVEQNHLDNNISLLGGVPNTEVFKQLALANIYILMSINEGLPISIIEAMRCSLPVITTDNSGMPEIVRDHYNGLVLETGNVDKLVEVFMNMDQYDWDQYATNSRKRFEEELTFNRMRKEYCDMIDSLFHEVHA